MPDGATRIAIPRWIQLVGLPLLLLLAWALASTLGRAVFLFVVAGLIALLLNPVVRALGRIWIPRGIAIAIPRGIQIRPSARTTGFRSRAMSPATTKRKTARPRVLASAQASSSKSGKPTSWIQRGIAILVAPSGIAGIVSCPS